jgi:hypothetical protein
MKLECSNKRSSRNCSNNWRLNNMLLSDQCVIEEVKEEIKFLEFNKNENTINQNIWDSKGSPKRKV